MPPATVTIVLVAAIAHATWNLASKYKTGDTVLFVAAYTSASAMLCLPLAITSALSGAQSITWPLLGAAVVSALLHLAYSLTLQAGYDRADLGIIYPTARGTGPLLTMVVAVLVLAERPSPLAISGAGAVLTGIIVVSGNHFRTNSTHPFRGVAWGTATGTTIAAKSAFQGGGELNPRNLRKAPDSASPWTATGHGSACARAHPNRTSV